jgi:hypothetical protein
MMKKTIAVLTTLVLISTVTPVLGGDEDIAGTFTPVSSGISISCNNTSPGFGNIALNGEKEITDFNLSNEGDTNCSVTMTAEDGAGTWTLVAGTDSPATTNEYCVNMDPQDGGYVDVQAQKTVISDLPPAGAANWGNCTFFDMKVHASKYTNEGTPGQQTFYANLTASALS